MLEISRENVIRIRLSAVRRGKRRFRKFSEKYKYPRCHGNVTRALENCNFRQLPAVQIDKFRI